MTHLKPQEHTRESSDPSSMEKGSQNSHTLESGQQPDEQLNIVRIPRGASTHFPPLISINKLN